MGGFATTREDFYEMTRDDEGAKKVPVEGDPWVSRLLLMYLANEIHRTGDFHVLDLAFPDDTAHYTLDRHGNRYKHLRERLAEGAWPVPFDVIFLNAAGDDIIGPGIRYFVDPNANAPDKYGRESLNPVFHGVLDDIASDYERSLLMRAKSPVNKVTPVIIHTYAYLAPRRLGAHSFRRLFGNGWIYVHRDDLGMKTNDERRDVAQGILEALRDGLNDIDATNFIVVDCLDVLSVGGMPDADLSYDETHPTSGGFRKVANRLKEVATTREFRP
jgi:hypothetical protein